MQIPVVADITKEIAARYGVLLESAGIALRGLFIINPEGIIQHITINDLPIGEKRRRRYLARQAVASRPIFRAFLPRAPLAPFPTRALNHQKTKKNHRPERQRGPPHAPGHPLPRRARRGVPGRLEAGRPHDEGRRGKGARLLWQRVQGVARGRGHGALAQEHQEPARVGGTAQGRQAVCGEWDDGRRRFLSPPLPRRPPPPKKTKKKQTHPRPALAPHKQIKTQPPQKTTKKISSTCSRPGAENAG